MLKNRCKAFFEYIAGARSQEIYPYFRPISRSWGTEVEVDGRRLVMVGSNDYLGLSHDPRVHEAAAAASRCLGTGPGGSRFLCGNTTLLEKLEERLAAFVGKKKAVVHVTGFSTNLGAIPCLLTPNDILLVDRESHASIFQGWKASQARLVTFSHNDAQGALKKLTAALPRQNSATILLITEGVFSMSGDIGALPDLMRLKDHYPNLSFYLDDAHGLGVLGPNGRGTAAHFGLTDRVDFIMGTFSKALASIGGFIAGDDTEALEYLRHHSTPLIFSAALPASNTATVLACLDILEREPERLHRLWEITRRVKRGYQEIGLIYSDAPSHIIPIHIGSEMKTVLFSKDLYDHGVFALPSIYPAVPKGKAVIRTAYMSTHQDSQVDHVLEVLANLAVKHRIRIGDQDMRKPGRKKENVPVFR
ncbi:MAG: pyridoxal phosphate-dependent aminotransferase family protein [Deltaproteobacteria bacterium]|nr:pyridoxal phosphate-dependent aminotransferase family protein [Deltaproteobacteria bacterium]